MQSLIDNSARILGRLLGNDFGGEDLKGEGYRRDEYQKRVYGRGVSKRRRAETSRDRDIVGKIDEGGKGQTRQQNGAAVEYTITRSSLRGFGLLGDACGHN